MTDLKDALGCVLLYVLVMLWVLVLFYPEISGPWSPVATVAGLVIIFVLCYSGEKQTAHRRLHLSRTYYLVALVAIAAIALTLFLSRLLGEAGAWLNIVVVFEFALSLPLFIYIAFAFILHEQ